MTTFPLPPAGFIRIKTLLQLLPISKSSLYAGIKAGRYPKPVKIAAQTSAWRVSDITELLDRLAGKVGG